MRIAAVWPFDRRLVDISVRFERYLRGFRALGHEAFAVCPPAAADGFPESVVTFPHPAAFHDHDFWQSLQLDAAVLITWLGLPEQVALLKRACPFVVSIADSDGQVGARVHPGSLLRRMLASHGSCWLRLRTVTFWLRQVLYLAPRLDRPILDSARGADLIAIGCPQAKENLARFFAHYRQRELCNKLTVIPYPIDDCFLLPPVSEERANRVIAVGRWDYPQKDAPLLCNAITRCLRNGRETEFILVGPGGEAVQPLSRRFSQVCYVGRQPPEVIASLMRRSRVLLMSSIWEGAPIVLNEALASGCSVVGPDSITGVVGACAAGPFGTVARGRSPSRLAAAIQSEMECWDRGERSPAAIAAYWRPQFDPVAVARQMLAPLTQDTAPCVPVGHSSPSCC